MQKFATAHASTHNHFNPHRRFNCRDIFKQNRAAALRLCDRCYLLEFGEATFSRSGGELLDGPPVKQAYLGG